MSQLQEVYLDGAWISLAPGCQGMSVENPTTEEVIGHLALVRRRMRIRMPERRRHPLTG